MSLAIQFVAVPVPARARPAAPPRLASISVLRPPRDAGGEPVRLTRRGVAVLVLAVAALGAGLVWLAAGSAPAPAPAPAQRPAAVTVQPGDTLWSIASRVAPQRDPRAEVADLQQRNNLAGVGLAPGQLLRIP